MYIDFPSLQQKSGRNLHIDVQIRPNSGCVLKLVRRLNKGFSPHDPYVKQLLLVHPPMIILSHETHKPDQKYNPKEGTGFLNQIKNIIVKRVLGFFKERRNFFDFEFFSCLIEFLLFFWSL